MFVLYQCTCTHPLPPRPLCKYVHVNNISMTEKLTLHCAAAAYLFMQSVISVIKVSLVCRAAEHSDRDRITVRSAVKLFKGNNY